MSRLASDMLMVTEKSWHNACMKAKAFHHSNVEVIWP